MNIKKHIDNIDKILDELFPKNYILNKNNFNFKLILLIFRYILCIIIIIWSSYIYDQKSKIERKNNIIPSIKITK